MFRVNTTNPAVTGVSHGHSQVITQQQTHHISQQSAPSHQQLSSLQQHSHQPMGSVLSQLDSISVTGGNGPNDNSIIINETILTAVKAEPLHETASTSTNVTNVHVLYTSIKRPRLEGISIIPPSPNMHQPYWDEVEIP
ncbi:hypothetical protein Bhyg_05355 [Pseudolycoriella hygida]|uniref:Uncharacterized protein n=1 Tax=Pseudolycoriella hygida TaxID=35572 RepID=A0A9Q0NGX1_9DIPT|nr:hypothetical protein Bhyg_05355 [Pseudolycoriella hygida]